MMSYGRFFILLLLFLYGCSVVSPPPDYYQKTLEMEVYGTKARKDTGRDTDDTVTPTEEAEATKVVKMPPQGPPTRELVPKPLQQTNEGSLVAKQNDNQNTTDSSIASNNTPKGFQSSPQHSESSSSPDFERTPKPIEVSSVVIKSALEIAGINVRSVELLNGRLGGGKNSVRINFYCESAALVNDRFFTICAVTYHLDKTTNSIDVVVGIAEDSQSNLIGVLQSNIEDISAWMNNLITRAEWFSRITRKML